MTAQLETNDRYKEYALRDNPFPESATLEPTSGDPRTSGEIFNGKIFTEEIEELRRKIDSKINMVYVTGGGWERGIGKSALVFHMWKSLKTKDNATAIYLRANVNSKPSDFCAQLVGRWQIEGHFWRAFRDLLIAYKQTPSPKIRPDKIDSFLETYQNMPDRVHLRVFTFEQETKVASDMQRWVQNLDNGLVPEAVYTFFEAYLNSPGEFMEKLSGLRVKGKDDIDFFSTYLRLLSLTRRLYHYLFIDQFEDAVRANQGKNQLPDFCAEMRRIARIIQTFLDRCLNVGLPSRRCLLALTHSRLGIDSTGVLSMVMVLTADDDIIGRLSQHTRRCLLHHNLSIHQTMLAPQP